MHRDRIAARLRSWLKNQSRTSCASVGLLFITDGFYTQYHLATEDHLPSVSFASTEDEARIGILGHEDHHHDSSHHPHSRLDHAPQSVSVPKPHLTQTLVVTATVPYTAPEREPKLRPQGDNPESTFSSSRHRLRPLDATSCTSGRGCLFMFAGSSLSARLTASHSATARRSR